MLVITVELLPAGYEPMRRSIATIQISNQSDLAEISDYRVIATESDNPLSGTPAAITECMVVKHDRRQSVWRLINAAAAELEEADWVPI